MLRFAGQRNSGMLPTLEAFSEFRLTVSAYNSRGAGPESEPHAFRTPEGGGRGAGGVRRADASVSARRRERGLPGLAARCP